MPRSGPYDRIYEILRTIPSGKVATYGQIARLAGMAGHARQVGYALHRLPDHSDVPWYRVINARGEISLHPQDVSSSMQRARLEKEGVQFISDRRVSLKEYGWRP